MLPPGHESVEVSGRCSAESTRALQYGPGVTELQVLFVSFHMHQVGRSAITRQFRDGKEIGILVGSARVSRLPTARMAHCSVVPATVVQGKEEIYSFDHQKQLPWRGSIRPGDELVTTCTYDTRSRNETTTGGLKTAQEMCWSECGGADPCHCSRCRRPPPLFCAMRAV